MEELGDLWVTSLQAGPSRRPDDPGGRAKLTMTLDTTAAPDCADFAKRCKVAGERYYPKIAALLPTDGYAPPDHTTVTFKPMDGVAYTQNTDVTCAEAYFVSHPRDVGAVIHELVHVDQHYTIGDQPGWLVEGIADWVPLVQLGAGQQAAPRQPGHGQVRRQLPGHRRVPQLGQAKYDRKLVQQLNNALRKGYYRERLWSTYTGGHTLEQLGDEWQKSLQPAH